MAAASPLSGNLKPKPTILGTVHFLKETAYPSEAQLGVQLETQLPQKEKMVPPLVLSSLDQPQPHRGRRRSWDLLLGSLTSPLLFLSADTEQGREVRFQTSEDTSL